MQSDASSHRRTRSDIDDQRAETGVAGTVGPSTPALPDSMVRGLWRGGVVGAVVGAIVLLPVALVPIFDLAIGVRVVIALAVGAAAGAAVGAVFFGGAVAETESEDDEGDESVVPGPMHRRDRGSEPHGPDTTP